MTEEIIKSVCREFQVTRTDLLSKKKNGMIGLARQALFLVTYECVTTNQYQIAKWYNRKSHNSTSHLVNAARDSCFTDKWFDKKILTLTKEIKSLC